MQHERGCAVGTHAAFKITRASNPKPRFSVFIRHACYANVTLEGDEKLLAQSKHRLNVYDEKIEEYDRITNESSDPDEIAEAIKKRNEVQVERNAEQLFYDTVKESMDAARKHM